MPEHEMWLTALLNQLLGKPVTSLLEAIGIHLESPSHPIPDYITMELVVVLFIMGLMAWLRGRFSADRPGRVQQLMELFAEGLGSQVDEVVGHGGRQFLPLIFTLGIFILLSNIWGTIPHFETPTGQIYVTLGCALVAFVYYNFWGLRHHGLFGYARTFMGPVLVLGPLMFVIEIISHLARVLSLSVRLFANMLAGEKITEIIFERILGLGAPVIFMGLHIFVGAIQAYIFVLLTMVYLGGAVGEEH